MKLSLLVIGAGVSGVSTALAALDSGKFSDVYVVERNHRYGEEATGRSSEVFHSGIFYKTGSKKQQMCVEGNQEIYRRCVEWGVPFKNTGKYIVGIGDEQVATLSMLEQRARENGVEGALLVDGEDITKKMNHLGKIYHEPNIVCDVGLIVPSTGVFDTSEYMRKMVAEYERRSGNPVMVGNEVTALEPGNKVKVWLGDEPFKFDYVVNAAGSWADKVVQLFDSSWQGEITSVVGEAVRFKVREGLETSMPIYGVPRDWVIKNPNTGEEKKVYTTGPHTTTTLGDFTTVGPVYRPAEEHIVGDRVVPMERDFRVLSPLEDFLLPYMPNLTVNDLQIHQAGTQAKHPSKDFNFVSHGRVLSLIGTDSPGWTSSGPIGREAVRLLLEEKVRA